MDKNMDKKIFVYGIDLGTTYSCIAYVDESGKPVIIPNKLTNAGTTPSVVLFETENKVVVGETAKGSAILDPDNTFDFVKQSMGMKDVIYMHHDKKETPVTISSYILKEIVKSAVEMTGYEIKDVVITCPAYFGTAETEATKAAGIVAGLNVMEIIREPTAAAIYYGCTKAEGNQNILIYDLGGGTFDVTVMRITKGVIEEICKEGSKELGGRNWDNAIMDYLWNTYCEETGYSGERDSYADQELKTLAEKLKWSLSEMDNAKVVLKLGTPKNIALSREVFDKLTSHLLNSTIDLTDKAIERAKEKGVEIDKILLVGGSTMMPQVKNILKKKYNLEPEVLEPNAAVAKGAAIYAVEAYKKPVSGDNKHEPKETLSSGRITGTDGDGIKQVLNTTKSYALKVMLEDKSYKCRNLIIKDTSLTNGVIESYRQFSTSVKNQTNVEIVVYESDFTEQYFDVNEDFLLGSATLPLPANLDERSPIDVTFILNTEGILRVKAKDATGGQEIEVEMEALGAISKEDIDVIREITDKVEVANQTSNVWGN